MVMTHHTAKADLEKGFSWPPEAIPYGLYLRVDFWYPKGQNPHLGPDPRCPQVLKPHLPIQLLIKDTERVAILHTIFGKYCQLLYIKCIGKIIK